MSDNADHASETAADSSMSTLQYKATQYCLHKNTAVRHSKTNL